MARAKALELGGAPDAEMACSGAELLEGSSAGADVDSGSTGADACDGGANGESASACNAAFGGDDSVNKKQ